MSFTVFIFSFETFLSTYGVMQQRLRWALSAHRYSLDLGEDKGLGVMQA